MEPNSKSWQRNRSHNNFMIFTKTRVVIKHIKKLGFDFKLQNYNEKGRILIQYLKNHIVGEKKVGVEKAIKLKNYGKILALC